MGWSFHPARGGLLKPAKGGQYVRFFQIGFICSLCVSSYSQFFAKSISFELKYPIPIGDNFINKAFDHGYLGLIDIGVDYNIYKNNGLAFGLIFNSSLLRNSEYEVNLLILSPKIKLEYEVDFNKILVVPQIAIGYSNWRFWSEMRATDEFGVPLGTIKYRNEESGLSVKGAAKVVINNDRRIKWYFNLSYEFTKLEKPEYESGNTSFSRNIQFLYPGIGVIWDFGAK